LLRIAYTEPTLKGIVIFKQQISSGKRSLCRLIRLSAIVLVLFPGLMPSLRAQETNERKPVYRVAPKYPEDLKRHDIGGVVRLSIEITPRGNVRTVSPIGGNPILVEAAIEAVKQWKYGPTEASQTLEVKIDFIQPSRSIH